MKNIPEKLQMKTRNDKNHKIAKEKGFELKEKDTKEQSKQKRKKKSQISFVLSEGNNYIHIFSCRRQTKPYQFT